MLKFHAALFFLLVPMALGHGDSSPLPTYMATISPIPGTDSMMVSGKVVVFAAEDGETVAYGGFVNGLQTDLQASTCTATNGCGVHIHSGKSCADSAGQGGHYFDDSVITTDPWTEARYSSDGEGSTVFSDILTIGTDDIEGRAFVVHTEDGSRIGCGLLTRVNDDQLLTTHTLPLGDTSTVVGDVTAYPLSDDSTRICVFGSAQNLEANILLGSGSDCTDPNGCGAHIHAGMSCENSESQMGHYYNKDILTADPWELTGYASTDGQGNGMFVDCLTTGFNEYDGHVFIVHANDGSRVSCGAMEKMVEEKPEGSAGANLNLLWSTVVPMIMFGGMLIA